MAVFSLGVTAALIFESYIPTAKGSLPILWAVFAVIGILLVLLSWPHIQSGWRRYHDGLRPFFLQVTKEIDLDVFLAEGSGDEKGTFRVEVDPKDTERSQVSVGDKVLVFGFLERPLGTHNVLAGCWVRTLEDLYKVAEERRRAAEAD